MDNVSGEDRTDPLTLATDSLSSGLGSHTQTSNPGSST